MIFENIIKSIHCSSLSKKICLQWRRPRLNPWVGKMPWRKGKYSCLENLIDRGAWWATVHGGRKESDTRQWLTLLLLLLPKAFQPVVDYVFSSNGNFCFPFSWYLFSLHIEWSLPQILEFENWEAWWFTMTSVESILFQGVSNPYRC